MLYMLFHRESWGRKFAKSMLSIARMLRKGTINGKVFVNYC